MVEQRIRLITEAEAVKVPLQQPVGQSAQMGAATGSNPLGGATNIQHHRPVGGIVMLTHCWLPLYL